MQQEDPGQGQYNAKTMQHQTGHFLMRIWINICVVTSRKSEEMFANTISESANHKADMYSFSAYRDGEDDLTKFKPRIRIKTLEDLSYFKFCIMSYERR